MPREGGFCKGFADLLDVMQRLVDKGRASHQPYRQTPLREWLEGGDGAREPIGTGLFECSRALRNFVGNCGSLGLFFMAAS